MHKPSTGFMPLNSSISNKEQKNNDGLVDDLEQQIQRLVLKKDKTNEEKYELQKLKNRKKVHKCREKKTLEEKEAQKKQHREYMKAARGLNEPEEHKERRKKQDRENKQTARGLTEPDEHKEMRKKQDRENKQTAKGLTEPEEHKETRKKQAREHKKTARGLNEPDEHKETRKKQDREHKANIRIGNTAPSRLKQFRERVRYGPIFPCITCEQTLFKHQVLEFDSQLKEQLKKECSEAIYKKALSTSRENLYLTINSEENTDEELERVTIRSGGETCFVCRVCCSYLKKGNLPPKAASNCLEVVPVPENIRNK